MAVEKKPVNSALTIGLRRKVDSFAVPATPSYHCLCQVVPDLETGV